MANAVVNIWPLESQCDKFYGNPRGYSGLASPNWEAANLTHINAPYGMTYAGSRVATIRIHRLCADSLLRVLNAIKVAAKGDQKLLDAWGASVYGGGYNFRLMRGGNHLSMHAYGCAIDLDPAKHPMSWMSKPFVPQVIKAFTDEGWVNLPHDRMHFQAAKIG